MPGRIVGKSPARSAVLALSAFLLGLALQINDGLYAPSAVALLALSLLTCLAGLFRPVGRDNSRPLAWFVAGLVTVQMALMLFHRAGASENTVPRVDHRPVVIGVCIALAAVGLVTFGNRRVVRFGFILLLTAFIGLGVWKIRSAPSPANDVVLVHVESARALTHGVNPYTITFPDIYGPDAHVYAPEAVHDGRVQFGYGYPPLPLLLTTAAQAVLGDFRYAQLIAMLVTGVLLSLILPTRVGMLFSALLLFTPRSLYVLETGWTEPISVMLLAVTGLCVTRCGKWHPAAFGLLLASKQYLPAMLVFPSVSRERSWRGRLSTTAIAIAVASATMAPFLMWDFKAFWHSVIEVQLHGPYRPDALNFVAWWGSNRPGWIGPSWVGFAAMFVGLLVSHWRKLTFTASCVICYFAFFAFGKQAFANYYYFILAALICEMCIAGRNHPRISHGTPGGRQTKGFAKNSKKACGIT